jgi:hypothetical protein
MQKKLFLLFRRLLIKRKIHLRENSLEFNFDKIPVKIKAKNKLKKG